MVNTFTTDKLFNHSPLTIKTNAMIKNYFKTAWRALWKNKTFSAINIFGLSIGVVALAFILVNNWLKDYAFHINIGIWFFFLPVITIVMIALLTVLYQSLKAAFANPVKNLRSE